MKNDAFLTIAYPTFRRPNRIEKIEQYYSDLASGLATILFSNNDSEVHFNDIETAPGSNFRYVDNLTPGKIGDNILNCIKNCETEYMVILSDEDFLFGLQELNQWLTDQKPDFFVLPALTADGFYRLPKNSSAIDVFSNKTGNLSGVGFKISALLEQDLSFCNTLDNKDYVFISLMAFIADRGGNYGMPTNAHVYMAESYYEGKKDFFEARRSWFSFEGRYSQLVAFQEAAELIANKDIKSALTGILRPGNFFVCFKYGFFATFRSAAKQGMVLFMIRSLLVGVKKKVMALIK